MSAITCCIRYELAPGKTAEFEHYARVWKRIIESLGGEHHGCFMPGEPPPDSSHFSFPGVGRNGPDNIAVVLFSFPDLEAYNRYRRDAGSDPECDAVTEHYRQTQCFTGYERTFLTPLDLS